MIDGGYIVTNAHVVWPYREARIVFPDGSEYLDTPVVAWEQLSDIAILGPIEVDADPLELVDGEGIVVGTDTYLIGYPGEGEEFPQPTITRGLVSRVREWDPAGITFFQTDAAITGGQSGGALVSDRGEVIGISEFRFTDAGFGLVESAADLTELIDGMIAGETVTDIGDRILVVGRGMKSHDITIANDWDLQAFVLDEPLETEVEIEIKSDTIPGLLVVDVYGDTEFFYDFSGATKHTATFETLIEAPYFIMPFVFDSEGEITLDSSHNLVKFHDPDDDIGVEFGKQVAGHMDHPWDIDTFNIELAEGDSIEITVDSMMTNPFVTIDFFGSGPDYNQEDDNSGEGIFGTNAKLSYEAPHTGSYFLIVEDVSGGLTGSYFIEVTAPDADSQSEAYALSLVASGNEQRYMDDTEKAIRLLTRAIELDPELASAYESRSRAHTTDDNDDLAIADISSAINLSPDDATFYRLRGWYYWSSGDFDSALTDFDAAIERDPEYASAYNMRSLNNAAMGNYEQALEDANTALTHQRRDNEYIKDTRAYVYLKLDNFEKALTEYRFIQNEYRESLYHQLGIGLAYAGTGDSGKAEDFLVDALDEASELESPNPQLSDLITMAEAAVVDL